MSDPTSAELLAAGWTRRGLIWHPPADLPDPPLEELEALTVTSENRKLAPCGTPSARSRHRRAGIRCIRCEHIFDMNNTNPGRGTKRRTA